ncbi:MAG TPA: DMT family transporter [Alphaproteobacteria bacterium]|nr:DMT family transporter [Alphaproteobacteria bacterium]
MTAVPSHGRGVILVMLAGVAFSFVGVVVRFMEAADGWQIVFYRSAGLLPTVLLLVLLRGRGRIVPAFRAAGWTAVIGGLFLAGGFTSMIFALVNTTVANTLFIFAAGPFLTAVLARLVLGERVARRTWMAMLVATIGVATMVGGSIGGGRLLGDLSALFAAFCLAGYSVSLRAGRQTEMLPTAVLGAVFSLLLCAMMMESFVVPWRDLALCLVLGSVIIGTGLVLFTFGSRYVLAAELGLLALTEVVLGPIWVWLAIGETPEALALFGGGMVLAAVVFQSLGGWRRAQALP